MSLLCNQKERTRREDSLCLDLFTTRKIKLAVNRIGEGRSNTLCKPKAGKLKESDVKLAVTVHLDELAERKSLADDTLLFWSDEVVNGHEHEEGSQSTARAVHVRCVRNPIKGDWNTLSRKGGQKRFRKEQCSRRKQT